MKMNIIAGPCSAESREQVLETARGLSLIGVKEFRAGVWKPRTRPGCFEGAGKPALEWLREVQADFGMKVCTEVALRSHAEACIGAGVDKVWIGARTTSNPFLVQELAETLAGTGIPVLIKNPVNPDLELWTGAVERFRRAGIEDVSLVHRGFSTFEKVRYRNTPDWQMALQMRARFPELPFYCDPSHMAGRREYIKEISQHALDLGLDGLMVESHCRPEKALSDAGQQLTPADLGAMLQSLAERPEDGGDEIFRSSLSDLRGKVDEVDGSIVRLLARRMDLVREIGRLKKDGGVSVIQAGRWEEVAAKAVAEAGRDSVDGAFIARIFNDIHEASIAEQNKIIQQ